MLTHPLTNFQIQKHYQNVPKFCGVYSRKKLLILKDWAYVTNLDDYKSIGTHWIAFYVNGDNITYFESCGVLKAHILKEIETFTGNKLIKTNVYIGWKQMIGYFCIGFTNFMIKDKILLDYTNLFFPNKNDKIILK